ncbi:MAG: hypothetical protein ACRDN9_06900 [Streptosporangiaceae bacterium]
MSTPDSPTSSLLAYVFWHWPPASAATPAYETDLLAFHASLASRPPPDFVGSATLAVSGVPWLPSSRQGYEDWYLVRDWAAVGELNRDAVAPAHAPSHDRIAHEAEAGIGALYALRAGDGEVGDAATWFAKPPGWSYAELDAALAGLLGEGLGLWRRQMVLGPAPEFCLRGHDLPALPPPLRGQPVSYRPLR